VARAGWAECVGTAGGEEAMQMCTRVRSEGAEGQAGTGAVVVVEGEGAAASCCVQATAAAAPLCGGCRWPSPLARALPLSTSSWHPRRVPPAFRTPASITARGAKTILQPAALHVPLSAP